MTVIDLSPKAVDAIAHRVVELLHGDTSGPEVLVDANEIASRFGVSRDWVYEHAEQLGVVRLGGGPKARLRFDPAKVAEALTADLSREPSEGSARRRRQRRHAQPSSVDLLPIRGQA